MKADLENLGKWVDELAGDIADLEKKIAQITPQPTPPGPTPAAGYHMTCTELIPGRTVTNEGVTTLDNIADMTGYDVILITLYDLTDGIIGMSYAPGQLFENSMSFPITSDYYQQEYDYKYAFKYRWRRQIITEQNYDTLTFTPIIGVENNIMIYAYGLKIEADETQQRSIVKKAAEAVKKAVRKKTTKGGKKKDASK